MKGQPNRLDIAAPHAFSGSAIDRTRPLKFRLDGALVHGFAGDTVLSALLASGVDTVGKSGGWPIGLGARFAPAVTAMRGQVAQALPMTRMPAIDGANLHLVGSSNPRWRLPALGQRRRSLGQDLDRGTVALPWHDQAPQSQIATDVIVVGGGVAGMSAAIAAARAGAKVTLLESTPMLGGSARYFGAQEGDETPDASIRRLVGMVDAHEAITVLLRTEALAVRPGRVRAHRVTIDGVMVSGEVIDLLAPRVVLATGAIERLPVFPGNRLPRVMSTLEAYLLAERYGVFTGRAALLATVHGAAYRLPMLLSDAGIATSKIADSRTDPQSRFIEYSRAYGITQAGGTVAALAEPAAKGLGLTVTLQLAFDGYSAMEAPVATDILLVCGGWQPDLTLWHMAGGKSRWSPERRRIEPTFGPGGIALAGSAAGYVSKHACLHSGRDAIDALNGAPRTPVVELSIDPIYETPDGPTPAVSRSETMQQPSYLDGGLNLIQPPDPRPPSGPAWWPFRRPQRSWSLADQPRALGIGDVVAGMQLGGIPAESVSIVAQERAVASGDLIDAARLALLPDLSPQAPAPYVPDYLVGRFGLSAHLWIVAPSEPRTLPVGALIFLNSDQDDPRQAIGAVVALEGDKTIALIGKPSPQPGEGMTVLDQGRPVAVRLVEPVDPPASIAALGSEASPA
ncbi:FAD-dependent oxidoreductase [uncultured Devosia sp.]|uniref:FAD-dependent oxidoreductase n=1 Tax=uncultured Devosia sp. TaxID=211434 RepID=UPI0035CC459D